MRKYWYHIVEPSNKNDLSHYFDVSIMVLIVLSVFDIILESEQHLNDKYGLYFESFEYLSVSIFTAEYLLRVWTSVENVRFKKSFSGRIRFMFTPMAIVDLVAILPFYLPFVGIDLRFLRMFRLFRVIRILKLARYSKAFDLIKKVFKEKKEDLLVTLGFIMIVLVIVSSLMYYLEKDVQPEHFSSISKSLWWGIVTLTTVGYGDVYPITPLGKIIGGMISLLGIGLVALPSGILASGYTEQIMKRKIQGESENED
ncbi:MAG: ion transporter [Bacteroidetes bacterium]|nr:ion transporter [Bacteroidota bacterium]MDA1121760.1 ion transporter [Bacteroidota bacterium]